MTAAQTLHRFLGSLGLVAACLFAAAPPTRLSHAAENETPSPNRARLTILHTSDSHGRVLPFDDTHNRPRQSSLAQVATLVRQIRDDSDHPVLVLDSGDTIQGTPLELFTSVRWARPSPTIETFNRIGYAAMAVGNHEFNFGLDVLRRAERHASFPFLSANTVDEITGEPAFTPYVVIEAAGLRVGILGLVTSNIPGWERPEHYRGLRFVPMDEAARHWVPVLRGDEACDLVVVLAHTGFEREPESGESTGTDYEDFGWRLSRVPGIDLLLTGHSHTDIPPRELNGVIVSQPEAYARFLTRIDLELERVGKAWAVASWQGENLPIRGVAADQQITTAFAETHSEVAAALAAELTRVTAPVSVESCRLEDCAAVDLIHTVQLETTGADLSLAAALSDQSPELAAGPVTWHWVYGFYVYPNTLVKVAVTGEQVKDILEHAARYYDGFECSPDGRCAVITDPEIAPYNVDSMAGVSYRIDPTREEGDRVRDLRRNGRPLDLYASFTLACNNYRAVGGGHYPHIADAEVLWASSSEMAELIGAYLQRHNPWHPTVDASWWIGGEISSRKTLPERP